MSNLWNMGKYQVQVSNLKSKLNIKYLLNMSLCVCSKSTVV